MYTHLTVGSHKFMVIQTLWVLKICWYSNLKVLKILWVLKICGTLKLWVLKIFWILKNLCKLNLWGLNFEILKKCVYLNLGIQNGGYSKIIGTKICE